MRETPSSPIISPKLMRIAELAKSAPDLVLTTLAHAIDMPLMIEAHRRTRKGGAVGIDGQTAGQYEQNLASNLEDLLQRAKNGTYRAPPVRRVHIPKGDGSKTRPIGIPTFEDKILQRAVAMVLEAVYEQDFVAFSWGFRPGRSAHLAVESTREELMEMPSGGWVLEVDIRGFFDALDHKLLREILSQRIKDGVLLRLISKWLHAGVMEDGVVTRSDSGTPQGGVVSPILANVYLHEVFDRWFVEQVLPRMRGKCFATRYADDIVIGFEREEDARRVFDVLPKRFGKYGLELHPEKTRLVNFRRPRKGSKERKRNQTERTSFDMLGFTLYWGRSRKGYWIVQQKTASSRFSRAVKAVWQWCQKHRHWPVALQHEALSRKIMGHYAYYGRTGNFRALSVFLYQVQRAWQYWLNRRSQRRHMPWEKFARLLERYPLPAPRIVHSGHALRAKLHWMRSRMR
jgi:group II intron reverse transcriptase/maturase